ncbi:MAG: integrase [Verrucomicrobiales bacterium]|jgi:integrase
MRGHIAKKGNRYYAVLYEGIDPGTGKPRHRWHSAGETRKSAEKVLADLVKRMHDGDYRSPDKITLADYMTERWLPSKRTRVKASTAAAYEANIRLHITPYIGHIPLQKLQPEDLDELYVKLLTDGRRNGAGGGLSAKSVRNVHATIQSALSDATRKGTVIRNVADIADPPSIGSSGRKMSVWSAEQLRDFLTDLQGHEMYSLFYLSANTGMRRGELLGLRWSNLDLDTRRLRVNQQIVSVEYELIEDDLKTPTSRRTIDLDERTQPPRHASRSRRHLRQRCGWRRSEQVEAYPREPGFATEPVTDSSPWTVSNVGIMTIPISAALEAFHTRESLITQFGDNALLLFALEMRFAIDDIETSASSCLTDGPEDRNCDAIYIDHDTGIAVIAQGFLSSKEKESAPANKASDLNTAASWIFGLDFDRMNESLQAAAKELDQAIREGELTGIELWYSHNLPESPNVKEELDRAAATARALIDTTYADADLTVTGLEVGRSALDDWYASIQNPILVADPLEVEVDGWFEEVGDDWTAVCVSVPASWLTDLVDTYGDKLFSANVRGYMPSRKTAKNINHNIEETARDKPARFWAYNNGITALVHDYKTPAELGAKSLLNLTGIAIVNGAQTTGALSRSKSAGLSEAAVLARFIRTSDDGIIDEIIRYNNSQNPIKPSDFRSTDRHQERLRRQFSAIPDAIYFGTRRGGEQDRARRPKGAISSDTVAQCLAAFHGDPGMGYHNLRTIWESDEIYSKYFSDSTTATHVTFTYTLLQAIQQAKVDLVQRDAQDELAEDEKETLAVFRQRGSQFLVLASIAACIEIVLSRPVKDRFTLSFGPDIGPDTGRSLWKPVVAALLPFGSCLRVEELKGSLRNKGKVEDAVKSFRSIVRSTASGNEVVFEEFAGHVQGA